MTKKSVKDTYYDGLFLTSSFKEQSKNVSELLDNVINHTCVDEYINDQINECKNSNYTNKDQLFDFQMLNSLKASIEQFKEEYKIVYGKEKK